MLMFTIGLLIGVIAEFIICLVVDAIGKYT